MKHSKQESSQRRATSGPTKARGSSHAKASTRASLKKTTAAIKVKGWNALSSGRGRGAGRGRVVRGIGRRVSLGRKPKGAADKQDVLLRGRRKSQGVTVHVAGTSQRKATLGNRSTSISPARSSPSCVTKVHQSRKDKSRVTTVKNIRSSRSSSVESNQSLLTGISARSTKTRSGSKLCNCEDGKQKGKSVRKKNVKDDKSEIERTSTSEEQPSDLNKSDKLASDASAINIEANAAADDCHPVVPEQHITENEKSDQKSDAKPLEPDGFPPVDQDHNYFAFPAVQSSEAVEIKRRNQEDQGMNDDTSEPVSSSGSQPTTDVGYLNNFDVPTEETIFMPSKTSNDQLNTDIVSREIELTTAGAECAVEDGSVKEMNKSPVHIEEEQGKGGELIQKETTQVNDSSQNVNDYPEPEEKQMKESEIEETVKESSLGDGQESSSGDGQAREEGKAVILDNKEASSTLSVTTESDSAKSDPQTGTVVTTKRGRGRPRKHSPAGSSAGSTQRSEMATQKTPAPLGRGRRKSSLADGSPRIISGGVDVIQNEHKADEPVMDVSEGPLEVSEPAGSLSQSKSGLIAASSVPAAKSRLVKARRLSAAAVVSSEPETEGMSTLLVKEKLPSEDGLLKLGNSGEGSSSPDLPNQWQGEEDPVGEKPDLDSSGSSQSLMDIFKHTIALRQQLAKERQKWQKPEDEDMSATSSVEGSLKNTFEVLKKGDQLTDNENLLTCTENYTDEGLQTQIKARRSSKDLKPDQGLSGSHQEPEVRGAVRLSSWRSVDEITIADAARVVSAVDGEKPDSQPHSRRSSLVPSGVESVVDEDGGGDDDDTHGRNEQQLSDGVAVNRAVGKLPNNIGDPMITSADQQPCSSRTKRTYRRKRSRRGLHLTKMFRLAKFAESNANAAATIVHPAAGGTGLQEVDTENDGSNEAKEQKLTRSECLMRARSSRGRRKWSRGDLKRAPSRAFQERQKQALTDSTMSGEDMDANKQETVSENSGMKQQHATEEGTDIKDSDQLYKGGLDSTLEAAKMVCDGSEMGKVDPLNEIKVESINECGKDLKAVMARDDGQTHSGDTTNIPSDVNHALVEHDGDLLEVKGAMQPSEAKDSASWSVAQNSCAVDPEFVTADGDQERNVNESTEGDDNCQSSVSDLKTTRKRRNKTKRRSELDLLNDVDGSISRRKKSKVYQKAYELYGEKGLFDNALAKTLLGLGKFDAENMSRSRLVEELAQKKGSTDLLNDSSQKIMTRRKQNRYSYLFRKKRRDSRPGSPVSSRRQRDSKKAHMEPKNLEQLRITEAVGKKCEANDSVSKVPAVELLENKPNSSVDSKQPEMGMETAMNEQVTDPSVAVASSSVAQANVADSQTPAAKVTKRKMKPSRPIKRTVDYSKLSGSIEYMVRYCKPCSIQLIDLIKCLHALKSQQNSIPEEEHKTDVSTTEDTSSASGLKGHKRKVHSKKSSQLDRKHEESSPQKKGRLASSKVLDENIVNFLQNSSSDLLSGDKPDKLQSATTSDGDHGKQSEPISGQMSANAANASMESSPRRSQRATMKSQYRCLFCKYTCHIRKIMEDHVYNHMNIIPYMCGLCYSIFGTRGGVRLHNRRCHPRHQPVIIKKAEVDESQYYMTVEEFREKFGDVSSVLPVPSDGSQQSEGQKQKKSTKVSKNVMEQTPATAPVVQPVDATTSVSPILTKKATPVIVCPQENPRLNNQQVVKPLSPNNANTGSAGQPVAVPLSAVSGAVQSAVAGTDTKSGSVTGAVGANNTSASSTVSGTSLISIDTEVNTAVPPKRSPIILRIPKIHQWKKDYSESSDDAGSSAESESRTVDESQSDGENLGATSDQATDEARQPEEAIENITQNEETEADDEDDAGSPMLKIVNVCSLAENANCVPTEESGTKEQEETAPTAAELLENLNTLISPQPSGTDGNLELDEVWQCLMCDSNTRLYDVMVEHIHRIHKKTYWYACPYCPFGCSQPRFNMYRHMRRTHPQKADNIFVGIIDSDRYFVKKKVGIGVTGTLESTDPGVLNNAATQPLDSATRNKKPIQSSTDKMDTSEAVTSDAVTNDTAKVKVKPDDDSIFTRSETGKKMVKPTAHVAPAVQNKTPVRDTVWTESPRGATVPVYIANNPTAQMDSAPSSGALSTTCKDVIINQESTCSALQSDKSKHLTDGQSDASSLAATVMTSPAYTAGDAHALPASVITSVNTSKVQPVSTLATGAVEPQTTLKTKPPPPLIPLGIVEASQVVGHNHTVPPLQRAPASAIPSHVLPQPAHQGSPHIIPQHSVSSLQCSANVMSVQSHASSLTVSMAQIKPSVGGQQRPVNTTLPIRSAEVQPVLAARAPKPAHTISLSEEEEARRAFSVFNISARMRQPNAGSVRPAAVQPPRAHTTPIVRPLVPRPAHSPPTTDIEQFKQFQLPPRPRISLPGPPSFSSHIPISAPPPYEARHITSSLTPMPPLAHTGVIRTMSRPSSAPEPPPALMPLHQRPPLTSSLVCQPTAAPCQPSLTPRPAHLNHVSHWTCPYCSVPNLMSSKALVEKHIRNCHPEHRVVYVPHNV